ncbi:MAG TPA: zf-HC2 domain-containing protein [Acidobacteriota bacterium]
MKCREFHNLVDSYLQGTIDEAQRERFEEHFFTCRKCFLSLQINETLRNKEVRISLKEKPRLFIFKVLKPMLVMSSLFLLILMTVLLLQQKRQARQLEELARFELPLYHQSELRNFPGQGAELEYEFSRAMRLFQDRRFAAALAILEQPSFAALAYPKIEFFRAICYLGENDADRAGPILDALIRAMDPAYFDEALYYKGFVLLRQGRKQAAKGQFAKIAGMLSPMSGKARAMVRKIDELS